MSTLYTVAFLNPCTARFELSTKSDLIKITNISDPTEILSALFVYVIGLC